MGRRVAFQTTKPKAGFSKSAGMSSAAKSDVRRTRPSVANLIKGFDLLRSYVPTYPPGKKLSKIETLRLALLYIKDLSRLVRDAEHGVLSVQSDTSLGDFWYPKLLTPSARTASLATVTESCTTETRLQSPPFEKEYHRETLTLSSGAVSPSRSDASDYSNESFLDDVIGLTNCLEREDSLSPSWPVPSFEFTTSHKLRNFLPPAQVPEDSNVECTCFPHVQRASTGLFHHQNHLQARESQRQVRSGNARFIRDSLLSSSSSWLGISQFTDLLLDL